MSSPSHHFSLEEGKKYVCLDKCEETFNALKECLTCAPVLAVPNPVCDFMVCTDASLEGVGAVLM